jgi:uncharacterized protein YqeY
MSVQTQIKDDMKTAMKAKDREKVTTLRGVMSAFTNELVAKGKMPQDTLSDEEATAVIKRESKKRKDSISQFEGAGRDDLASGEKSELAILEAYLPELMSKEQILPVAKAKIEELGITDKTKVGMLMGAIMKELGSNVDGNDVREVVMGLLA